MSPHSIVLVALGSTLLACNGDAAPDASERVDAPAHPDAPPVDAPRPEDCRGRWLDGRCILVTPDDQDADGYTRDVDCDDMNFAAHPGGIEFPCNGIDEDCDGSDLCPRDQDGDGFGEDQDCDDLDASRYPGAPEIPCNGIDESCSGCDGCTIDNDGDRYGTTPCGGGDCDDDNPDVYPGHPEVFCDGIDQDCDGVDCCTQDEDMDGYVCRDDCNDRNQLMYPGAAPPVSCPAGPVDNDCSGVTERDELDCYSSF